MHLDPSPTGLAGVLRAPAWNGLSPLESTVEAHRIYPAVF